MRLWRRYWYWIGGIIFVVLAFFMGLWGSGHLPVLQTILIFSWMAMLVHQIEEYGFPGGFPSISNMAIFKERKAPYCYIFNAQQCFVCNVFLCYAAYIIPIFFPDVVWLGAAQVLYMLLQLLTHGIMVPIALRWIYNPGLAATVFLQLPVAIYYIWYVVVNMPDAAWQIWIGIPVAIVIMLICFAVPVVLMRNRNSRYPFPEEEMFGYKKDQVLEIYNNGKPSFIEKLGIHFL